MMKYYAEDGHAKANTNKHTKFIHQANSAFNKKKGIKPTKVTNMTMSIKKNQVLDKWYRSQPVTTKVDNILHNKQIKHHQQQQELGSKKFQENQKEQQILSKQIAVYSKHKLININTGFINSKLSPASNTITQKHISTINEYSPVSIDENSDPNIKINNTMQCKSNNISLGSNTIIILPKYEEFQQGNDSQHHNEGEDNDNHSCANTTWNFSTHYKNTKSSVKRINRHDIDDILVENIASKRVKPSSFIGCDKNLLTNDNNNTSILEKKHNMHSDDEKSSSSLLLTKIKSICNSPLSIINYNDMTNANHQVNSICSLFDNDESPIKLQNQMILSQYIHKINDPDQNLSLNINKIIDPNNYLYQKIQNSDSIGAKAMPISKPIENYPINNNCIPSANNNDMYIVNDAVAKNPANNYYQGISTNKVNINKNENISMDIQCNNNDNTIQITNHMQYNMNYHNQNQKPDTIIDKFNNENNLESCCSNSIVINDYDNILGCEETLCTGNITNSRISNGLTSGDDLLCDDEILDASYTYARNSNNQENLFNTKSLSHKKAPSYMMDLSHEYIHHKPNYNSNNNEQICNMDNNNPAEDYNNTNNGIIRQENLAIHMLNKYQEQQIDEEYVEIPNEPENYLKEGHMSITKDIYQQMIQKDKDQDYNIDPYYLSKTQISINSLMRAILIDWMMEVCSEFSTTRETLYNALHIVDRYLFSKPNIQKKDLQLVGVTALFVASKIEEVTSYRLMDYSRSTNDAYTVQEILNMEIDILKTLKWKLSAQTLYNWANFYMTAWDEFIDGKYMQLNDIFLNRYEEKPYFKQLNESSYVLFKQLAQYIDCATLNYETLQYQNRPLIASFMYLILGKYFNIFNDDIIIRDMTNKSMFLYQKQYQEYNNIFSIFIKQCFDYKLDELLPTIQYCSLYFKLQINYDFPIAATRDINLINVNYEEFLSYQTYNKDNIEYVKRLNLIKKAISNV